MLLLLIYSFCGVLRMSFRFCSKEGSQGINPNGWATFQVSHCKNAHMLLESIWKKLCKYQNTTCLLVLYKYLDSEIQLGAILITIMAWNLQKSNDNVYLKADFLHEWVIWKKINSCKYPIKFCDSCNEIYYGRIIQRDNITWIYLCRGVKLFQEVVLTVP